MCIPFTPAIKLTFNTTSIMTWQEVAEKARRRRDDTIAQVRPPVPEIPSTLPRDVTPLPKAGLAPKEVRITESPAEELVASIASGILTSTEVTNAFLRRAALAQKLVQVDSSCPLG